VGTLRVALSGACSSFVTAANMMLPLPSEGGSGNDGGASVFPIFVSAGLVKI